MSNINKQNHITVSGYEKVDGVVKTIAITQFSFNPNDWDYGTSVYFEVGVSTSNVIYTTTVLLYNLTDGETVTGTTLTTNSLSPTRYSTAALTVGAAVGNIKTSTKVYEVRLTTDGILDTDFGYLNWAMMRVTR